MMTWNCGRIQSSNLSSSITPLASLKILETEDSYLYKLLLCPCVTIVSFKGQSVLQDLHVTPLFVFLSQKIQTDYLVRDLQFRAWNANLTA